MSRREALLRLQHNNSLSASHQRMMEKQNHEFLDESFVYKIQDNRKKCQKEKREYQKRRKAITQKIEARKQEAKNNFRGRWLKELNKTEEAKEEYFAKKE
jgi:hypothetical protein